MIYDAIYSLLVFTEKLKFFNNKLYGFIKIKISCQETCFSDDSSKSLMKHCNKRHTK